MKHVSCFFLFFKFWDGSGGSKPKPKTSFLFGKERRRGYHLPETSNQFGVRAEEEGGVTAPKPQTSLRFGKRGEEGSKNLLPNPNALPPNRCRRQHAVFFHLHARLLSSGQTALVSGRTPNLQKALDHKDVRLSSPKHRSSLPKNHRTNQLPTERG